MDGAICTHISAVRMERAVSRLISVVGFYLGVFNKWV